MKKYFISVLPILLFVLFFALPVQANVPTPQIYNVVHSADNSHRPWVIGWTPNEVEVEVFMDEVSQGFAKVVKDKSGTASFGWSPQRDLPLGWHEFRVRGKHHDDFSELGGIIGYKVSPPTPAPTLFTPEDFTDHILIKGLIKNDSVVNIYIDGKLAADFAVPNHPSGTTNFWFKAKYLLNGVHEVYAVAYDDTGKPSKKSEVINFKTEQQKITKGESEDSIDTIEIKENKVIDEPIPGTVTITNEQSEAEVRVDIANPDEREVLIVERTTSSVGEVSSVSEVAEQPINAELIQDRENRNRYIGLLLLGLATILLYTWYWHEKKKVDKENKL
jgi:hypothetical protein